MDTDGIERLIGRLYTSFILRDFAFVVSGSIAIAVAIPHPLDIIEDVISTRTGLDWLAILAFLALSYTLGVLLQEAALIFLEHIPKWWRVRRSKDYKPPELLVVRMDIIHKKCSPETALGVERVVFLKQIAATQLATFIAIAGLRLRDGFAHTPVFAWILILFGILLCWWMYYSKSRQQEELLSKLTSM